MAFLKAHAPRVPKTLLFLFAGLVWCFAGYQILSIGLPDMTAEWVAPILNLSAAAAVFLLFFLFVFSKMVKKHCRRIRSYEREKVCMFAFFDVKGYLIMACMITFGILLRSSHLVPPLYLGTFYTGLGASLAAAGGCFLISFVQNLLRPQPDR